MSPKLKNTLTVVVAVGAAAAGGTAIAAAGGTGGGSGNSSRGSGYGPPRSNETPLTGATADKVEAAALARVPGGTIVRVETDDGGVYEAHVRKADGTEVEVKVNAAFEVTAVEEHSRRGGPGGRHGHRGGPGRGGRPAELTGTTAAKVKAAALARVKGGTVLFTHRDRDGAYEAHVRRADGTEVEVEVNRAFKVTAVEQHEHRSRP